MREASPLGWETGRSLVMKMAMVMDFIMMKNDDDDEVDDDEVGDDDDDDEVDWLAWFSANAVNSPLPNSPLSAPTKIFFFSIAIIVSFDGDDSILPKEMLLHFT